MTKSIPRVPVLFIAFNRTDTLRVCLDAFLKCDAWTDRPLYAYLDGPRNTEEKVLTDAVFTMMEEFRLAHCPEMIIVCRDRNLGSRGNTPPAITELLHRHGRLIIIEDDIVVSKYFLNYMDEALEFYEDDKRIWGINAWRNRFAKVPRSYRNDVYLHQRNMCWGWGTWKDRWEKVDGEMKSWPKFKLDPHKMKQLRGVSAFLPSMLDSQYQGRLKAWDVQCSLHIVEHNLYCVEPVFCMTKNIGCGTVGSEHITKENAAISTQPFYNFKPKLTSDLYPDAAIERSIGLSDFNPSIVERLRRKVLSYLWSFQKADASPLEVQAHCR